MSDSAFVFDVESVVSAVPPLELASGPEKERLEAIESAREQELVRELDSLRVAMRERLMNGSATLPQWGDFASKAMEYLVQTSRRMKVVVFLTEALGHEHGWAGLTGGFRLYRRLLEAQAENVRPLSPPAKRIDRHKFLVNAATQELARIKAPALPVWNIPVIKTADGAAIGLYEIEAIQQDPEATVRLEMIKRGLDTTSGLEREKWLLVAQEAVEEWGKLEQAVVSDISRDGGEAMVVQSAFGQFRGRMEEYISSAKTFFASSPTGEAVVSETPVNGAGPVVKSSSTAPTNRQEAKELLDRAARYFETADPHSLVCYRLRTAQRWLDADLRTVLGELVTTENELHEVMRLMSINPAQPPNTPRLVETVAPVQPIEVEAKVETITGGSSELMEPAKAAPVEKGIGSRAEALGAMNLVLRYLETTEPHSFSRFPLEFAARIVNMPLANILYGTLTNESVQKALFRELGVANPTEQS